jgi:hypothetical protein
VAVAVEIEIAFQLVAELVEIVPVAGREEIVGRIHHFQQEIAGRAFVPTEDVAELERALAMLVDALGELDFVAVHQLHGRSPGMVVPGLPAFEAAV